MKIKKKKIENLIKIYEEEYTKTTDKITRLSAQINNYEPRYGPRDIMRTRLEKEWRTLNDIIRFLKDLEALLEED